MNVMTTTASTLYTTVKRALIRHKNSLIALMCLGLYLCAGFANAQDITMPTVDIDGIDADSSGDVILITIIKYVARIAIWALMLIAGYIAVKRILSSWNEQKQNDNGRWGAVIGDSIGSIIMVILVIAVGTWLLTFLA